MRRFVVDASVVISAMLFPGSVPHQALPKARFSQLLASESMHGELIDVLLRNRLDRYVDRTVRMALAAEYLRVTELIDIPVPVRICRDPRDDKSLEVALHGRADAVITGDQDLLMLHPFRGISIF